MKEINLWEAMTALKTAHGRNPLDADGPRVTSEDLQALGKVARYRGGQEISLKATPEGWVIQIFSCYSEGGDQSIKILIPEDFHAPVVVEEGLGLR